MATPPSGYLSSVARKLAEPYVRHLEPAAMLLTGSAAEGISDYYSDLDLIVYYDQLPTMDALAEVRSLLSHTDLRVTVDVADSMTVEEFVHHGIECQIAHCTVEAWEREMSTVLSQNVPATTVEKAIIGLLNGVPLRGDPLIHRWQEQAARYPDDLATATVEHYLRFFPLWLAAQRWRERDAAIFYFQMLAETSLNLLGVLAGINHTYFSTFQFKRMRHFTDTLAIAPEHLAQRLDRLFVLEAIDAGTELEKLVDETIALVATHLPDVDTTSARSNVGLRHQPWNILSISGVPE